MRRPVVGERSQIVDVDFEVAKMTQNTFHHFLSNIRGSVDAHGEATIPIKTEGSRNGAKISTFFVHVEGIVLHGEIELGEKFVTFATRQNFVDLGQRIELSLDSLVERTEIRDPANSTIFLGDDKGT